MLCVALLRELLVTSADLSQWTPKHNFSAKFIRMLIFLRIRKNAGHSVLTVSNLSASHTPPLCSNALPEILSDISQIFFPVHVLVHTLLGRMYQPIKSLQVSALSSKTNSGLGLENKKKKVGR